MKRSIANDAHTTPAKLSGIGRGYTLGRALWLCDWLQDRHFPFTAVQLAIAMEASKRTALYWLDIAEGVGLVECDRSDRMWRWRTRPR